MLNLSITFRRSQFDDSAFYVHIFLLTYFMYDMYI